MTAEKQAPSAEALAHELCRISGYAYESAVYYARADQIVEALRDAGYVIVPREPTEAMIGAAFEIETERYAPHYPQEDKCAVDCWRAMIDAAK